MFNSKRPKKSPSAPRPPTSHSALLRELLAGMFDRIARDNAERAASLLAPAAPGSSRLARVPLAVLCTALSGAAGLEAQRIRAGATGHPAAPGGRTPPA